MLARASRVARQRPYENKRSLVRLLKDAAGRREITRKDARKAIRDISQSGDEEGRGNGNRAQAAAKESGISGKPALLAGGNPRIRKGEGDAPGQAFLSAMQGWKAGVGRRIDALIEIQHNIPFVRKGVRWNSPTSGVRDKAGFWACSVSRSTSRWLSSAALSLCPLPPGESKSKDTRYLDIREDDLFDEAQFADWVKQASQLPGERM